MPGMGVEPIRPLRSSDFPAIGGSASGGKSAILRSKGQYYAKMPGMGVEPIRPLRPSDFPAIGWSASGGKSTIKLTGYNSRLYWVTREYLKTYKNAWDGSRTHTTVKVIGFSRHRRVRLRRKVRYFAEQGAVLCKDAWDGSRTHTAVTAIGFSRHRRVRLRRKVHNKADWI